MSSGSFWSDACTRAQGKPLQTLLDAAYASCCVTVRQPCALLLPVAVDSLLWAALPVTICCADCCVFCERLGRWYIVSPVVADGR
jgi:hypothetical protein